MTFKGYKLLNLCLIFILSHWFVIIESFIPVGRYAHSSVLVGEKLYFFGGMNDDFKCLNEVFYLDVSRPFNSAVPPWVDLTQNAGLPFKSCWATVSLNYKEQIIYLFGGFMLKDTNQDAFESSVYSFDLNTVRWNIPNIRGILPRRRRKIKSIIDDNTGKIYIFGGQALIATTLTLLNDMVILNTVESSWLNNPPVNSPSLRTGYTATLLKNGIIAYIGGIEMIEVNTTRLVDINRIYLYDTKSLTWSVKIARSSNIIENRNGHAAVLAPNDEIIIYGGSRGVGINERVVPDLFVLNTNTEQFKFTIPPVTSKIGQVPSITIHTADLVVNYMIVAFGNITQPNSNPLSLRNPNIYIMDIRNYTWVDSFDPTNMGTKTNPSAIQPSSFTKDLNKDLVTLKIVIGSIGAILCVVIIIVCGFLIYRWNAKKKEQSPTTISTAPVTSIGHNDQNDKEHNLSEVII